MLIRTELQEATHALRIILDEIDEIDLSEISEGDKKRISDLADLCAEFGVHFNAT